MLTLITEPRLYLLGRSALDRDAVAQFLTDEGRTRDSDPNDAEDLIKIAGQLCYMSFGQGRKGTAAYLANILGQSHFSVTEHAAWTFLLTGVSRSLTHELVRHRMLSFSELSQRYVDAVDLGFVVPPAIQALGAGLVWERFEIACIAAQRAYTDLVDLLLSDDPAPLTKAAFMAARQAARSVLPNATETKIVVTGNARAWRHFITLRAGAGAEPEIRRLALVVLRRLQTEAPHLFGDYIIAPHADGGEIATPIYREQ